MFCTCTSQGNHLAVPGGPWPFRRHAVRDSMQCVTYLTRGKGSCASVCYMGHVIQQAFAAEAEDEVSGSADQGRSAAAAEGAAPSAGGGPEAASQGSPEMDEVFDALQVGIDKRTRARCFSRGTLVLKCR